VVETIVAPANGVVDPLSQEDEHYRRNLPDTARTFFETVIDLAKFLPRERQRRFVRLVLLAVGQWALDCKTQTRSWTAMREQFCTRMDEVLGDHYEFLSRAAAANDLPRCRLTETRRLINRSCEESGQDGRFPEEWLPARLVVTSPPYPGVHVVYHRWQIRGRRETPAPFWLANSRDGAGEPYYCLGRRDEPELKTYFERLCRAFASVSGLLDARSTVVQLVAFSQPEWQLPAYLGKMAEAGYRELTPLCDHGCLFEGRVWRQVPGRKWYAKNRGEIPASKEVMLFHRISEQT
jgi:hypothetical protein